MAASISIAINNQNNHKKLILVVDDSRTVRASLTKILSNNFDIITAEDGEDGWQKLLDNPKIDLVISDIMMPKLDGYGLICRIRGCDELRINKTPIIVVTSAEDDLTRERAHACGANNFIVKPVNNADLLERVNFHTEAGLTGEQRIAPQMSQYEKAIEHAVIEAPDIDTALRLLAQDSETSLEPYAIDLALQVLPLLEYCNKQYDLIAEDEILSLKQKLKAV